MDEKEYDPKYDVDFNRIKIAFRVILIIGMFIITFSLFSGLVRASETDLVYTPTNDLFYNSTAPVYHEQFNIRNQTEFTGIYDATYSFTNEITGTINADIDFIDSIDPAVDVVITIKDEYKGHSKILNCSDGNPGDNWLFRNNFNEDQEFGTIEFWISAEDATNQGALRIENNGIILFSYFLDNDFHSVTTGGSLIVALDDTWYQIRLDYECTAGGYQDLAQFEFHIFINGIEYGDYAFSNNEAEADRIQFFSDFPGTSETYIDAWGYSWDGYNGTYSFTDDIIGTEPEGWVSDNGVDCTTTIIDQLDGHQKVLNINDSNNSDYAEIYNSFSAQITGSIEWWQYSTNVVNRFQILMDDVLSTTGITLRLVSDNYQSIDGNGDPIASVILIDNWYHHRIDFDCVSDTFDWYINDILELDDTPFLNNLNEISKITLLTYSLSTDYYTYFDGIGYSWDPFYEIGDNLKHYSIGDNIIPLSNTLEINEVDRFEFAYSTIDTLNAIGLDDPNGWSDIEEASDTVNIQAHGTNDRLIYMFSGSQYFGLVRSDFDDLPNTIDAQRVNVSFKWRSNIDHLSIFIESDFEVRSSDNTLIVRVRLAFDSSPTFVYKLQYYDGSSFVDLDVNVESWYDENTWYDFNIFIDYPSNLVTLWFNDGTNDVFYHFPTITTGKSGLKEVRYYNDDIGGITSFQASIDSIGVYCDGIAINDEWGWKSIDFPSNWDLRKNNLFDGDYTNWANISVCDGVYSVGVSDFYDLFGMYFNSYFFTHTQINLYTQYGGLISDPYLIIYQINVIDDVFLGWTDVRRFDLANITIEGVKLVEGSNEYPLIYTYPVGFTDPFANYFYVSDSVMRFTLTCQNSNLEYIQANFDITDIPGVNRSIKTSTFLEGFPFLYGDGAFSLKFTDATTLSFVLTRGGERFSQILPQDKVLNEFVFLITDDDRDVASGNTMTGYLNPIVLVFYPNLAISIVTTDLLLMLIPLFVLILPPLALYKKFGYKVVLPMMMVMSIVSVASGLIPYWMFFVLMFCFVSFILIQRRSEGGGFL